MFQSYQIFIVEVAKKIKMDEAEPIKFHVAEMDGAGLRKVRYVGAWAVRKCHDKARRYVITNKNSEVDNTREELRRKVKILDLLENSIVLPHQVLEKTTAYPQTLSVTESRQYRARGLLHITNTHTNF